MEPVTTCSDFGAPQNKACHCFHCFPIYLPQSDWNGCHDLSFVNELLILWMNSLFFEWTAYFIFLISSFFWMNCLFHFFYFFIFLNKRLISGHKLLIAKFRLTLKKVGETTRPFRCDLNQIPNDYTVEVRNRFKGLDLIECLMNYGRTFMTLYRRQGARSSPRKRNAKRQNGCLRRSYKYLRKEEMLKAKEKRKDIPIWMQSSKE